MTTTTTKTSTDVCRIGPTHWNSDSFWFVIEQPQDFDTFSKKKKKDLDLSDGNAKRYSPNCRWPYIQVFHFIEPSKSQVRLFFPFFDDTNTFIPELALTHRFVPDLLCTISKYPPLRHPPKQVRTFCIFFGVEENPHPTLQKGKDILVAADTVLDRHQPKH